MSTAAPPLIFAPVWNSFEIYRYQSINLSLSVAKPAFFQGGFEIYIYLYFVGPRWSPSDSEWPAPPPPWIRSWSLWHGVINHSLVKCQSGQHTQFNCRRFGLYLIKKRLLEHKNIKVTDLFCRYWPGTRTRTRCPVTCWTPPSSGRGCACSPSATTPGPSVSASASGVVGSQVTNPQKHTYTFNFVNLSFVNQQFVNKPFSFLNLPFVTLLSFLYLTFVTLPLSFLYLPL